MLAFGDASNCGQYHSIGFSGLDKVLTASPVKTALLDLGEERKPCRYTNKVEAIKRF
jgi:hypothetical protein